MEARAPFWWFWPQTAKTNIKCWIRLPPFPHRTAEPRLSFVPVGAVEEVGFDDLGMQLPEVLSVRHERGACACGPY